VSGQPYVLGQGYLPKALRATMAIPGIFTPVDWDDRILSDGGIANNLPTDVVKAMGADVVIGVTLRIAPAGASELRSLVDILRQSSNIAVVQNELRNLPVADIDIAVQLGNRASMDFSDTASIIELGYDAAAQNRAALEKLSLSPDRWQEYIRSRRARLRTMADAGPIVEVAIPQPDIQRDAAAELERKTGSLATPETLDETLSGLMAATGLPIAFYGWHRPDAGPAGFRIQLEPRRSSEIVVRPSLFYQFSGSEPNRLTLRLSGAAILKDAYKSRFLGNLNLGNNPGVMLEYYHPIDGSAYFIAPGFSVERTRYFSYADSGRIDRKRDRFAGSLFGGIGTWRHLQLRAGARAGFDRYSDPAADETAIAAANTAFIKPEVNGTINTQDSGQLPSRGIRLNAAAGWTLQDHSFPYIHANFDHFQPVGDVFSLFAMAQADSSLGRKLTFYDQYSAGGLGQLDGYRYQELRADTLLAAGGGALYRGANPREEMLLPIFGVWYEAARLKAADQASHFRQSAAAGIFTPTPLGLVGLSFSIDMKGSARFRFSIGSFWNQP
jgi:NTE family protein